ncbi:hypothetical protein FACS189481_5970 [Clostridia bacterium]|nr:hypothetical protein FACS189481_5970 [Clostridia bacterium]
MILSVASVSSTITPVSHAAELKWFQQADKFWGIKIDLANAEQANQEETYPEQFFLNTKMFKKLSEKNNLEGWRGWERWHGFEMVAFDINSPDKSAPLAR